MKSLKAVIIMLFLIVMTVISAQASTSVVTLYKSPQKVIAHGSETDTYSELVQQDGFLRVKIVSQSDVQFELHIAQESIDSDYGDVYTRNDWKQSGDQYVWEGHVPVVEGNVDVSVHMGSLTSYVITIQWAEFENGNGYILNTKTVKMLSKETYTLSVQRDVGDDKYSGSLAISNSNPKIVKVVKAKNSRIQLKALATGMSTIKVVLDNKQVLNCKVKVTNNVYTCKSPKENEYNDEWSCVAYVTKAKYTTAGNLKLYITLNNQWMNSAFGWKGQVVGLTENDSCFLNVTVNKSYNAKYGASTFTVTVPKKYLKMKNVKLTTSTFTSMGRVIAY